MLRALTVLLAILTTGCASNIPESIRKAPADAPTMATVRANTADALGQSIRWGGEIESIDNQPEETELEIVSRPLSRQGKPQDDTLTLGRFIAKIPGFLDPSLYSPGRYITVVGTVDGETSRTIGNHEYSYPIILVRQHYLWRKEDEVIYVHDPFYDPYFPAWHYRPYPYFYPYPYYPRRYPHYPR